ncbi:MAG: nucleoside triphosphate pyrophosphohydrolase [Chloroflexota bacterium]
MPGITLLGLGPGEADLLTRQAWEILQHAPELYLRTRRHPAVQGLPEQAQLHSFDDLYEQAGSFEAVYSQIVDTVLSLGRRPQGVVYAVPGHPFIAETTGPEIARRARQEGLPVRVVEGVSFLEPVFSALGLDPFPHTALVDALELVTAHVPPFPTSTPAVIAQIHSRQVANDLKLTLNSLYPDEHPVRLVHAAGSPNQVVEDLALYEIDRSRHIGLLTALFLPPLSKESGFEAFLEIVAHLRDPETGCPWDKEQTHKSLRSGMLEEVYELLAAIDAEDEPGMREELGDVLLNILLQAQIAADAGEFTIADVLTGLHTKIVGRHPHVFGDAAVAGVKGVLQNWERLKAQERAAKGKSEASLLDGVNVALPALIQAEQYSKRAARVGFDWPDIQGVLEKLEEELAEVHAARDGDERFAEIGDLLFSVVNLARWHKVDSESALREANARFRRRFSYIEAAARRQGRPVDSLSLAEMEALWQEAKRAA